MKNQPIQVGFVGTGYIADWHARALRSVRGVRLAAVCDLSLSRAQAFADRFGVGTACKSVDELIAGTKLDAVHVLLPPQHHFQAARQLLESGVHVLLEKPMATSAAECDTLTALATEKQLQVGVSHNFLFSESYEALRNDLKAGRLGKIDHIAITWRKELGFIKHGPFNHFSVREPGNVMFEVGVHAIAHIVDLLGADLEDLRVEVSRPADLPDGGIAYRRWRIGALHGETAAEVHLSLGSGLPEHTIHVRGSLGSATCDFEANTYVLRRDTGYSVDLNRFVTVRRAGRSLKQQGWRNLVRYVLSKAKLSRNGNAFEASIAGSLQAFYGALRSRTNLDARLAPGPASDMIRVIERVVKQLPPAPNRTTARVATSGREANVLVTGGTGFIGRELVKQLLARGERVRIITRQQGALPFDFNTTNLDVVTGDVQLDDDQEKALDGIEVVHHLARSHGRTYDDYVRNDIDPTRRFAEKAIRKGVKRFIYASSIVVFNWADNGSVIRDDSPIDAAVHRRAAYTRAKAEAERMLLTMHREQQLPAVIVRPGIVLGPGGDPCHWGVGMWQAPGVCQVWGKGNNPLPFVLVEDVVAGMILAQQTEEAVGKTFNLVDQPMLSAREYLEELEKAGGIQIQKYFTHPWRFYAGDCLKYAVKVAVRHPGRTRPSYRDWNARRELSRYDTSLTQRLLGWKPTADRAKLIERGVRQSVKEWMS